MVYWLWYVKELIAKAFLYFYTRLKAAEGGLYASCKHKGVLTSVLSCSHQREWTRVTTHSTTRSSHDSPIGLLLQDRNMFRPRFRLPGNLNIPLATQKCAMKRIESWCTTTCKLGTPEYIICTQLQGRCVNWCWLTENAELLPGCLNKMDFPIFQ